MNLDLVTRQTLNQVSSLQKQYIRDLSDLLESGNTLTPKTVETKIKRAKERLKEYEKEMKSVFKEATKEVWNGTLTDTFKEMKVRPNLDAVSGRQLATLETAGLQFMHNYEDSMIQQVKTQLYVSLLNGESATDAYKRIQPLGNANARPKVMIRDQLSRTYQQAIIESYGATGHPQDFEYYWTGPDDERTTEICEERKAGNPYSWEQVKELDSHPHIQCRHRWRAVAKSQEQLRKERYKRHEEEAKEEAAQKKKRESIKGLIDAGNTDLEGCFEKMKGLDQLDFIDRSNIVDEVRKEVLKQIEKHRGLNTKDLVFQSIDHRVVADLNRVAKMIPEQWVQLAESRRGPCKVMYDKRSRGFYVNGRNEMMLSDDIRVTLHEYGHRLEYNVPNLKKKVIEFYKKRTKGEKAVSLRDVTGVPYRPEEITKLDKFCDPYIGKLYEYQGIQNATEILSMGLEGLFYNRYNMWEKDPEMIKFIYGLLVTI